MSEGVQVLVVEDNEKNMKLFRDVLDASGYRTLEAATGERAVELVFEHRPDLVLMDIQLPDIDGIEALSRLRADDRTASVPVLALTAQAMEGDRERFLAAGFDGYLSKPVDIAEFVATIKRYCEDGSGRATTRQGSSWSTMFQRTCACSRPFSTLMATTSSRPRTAVLRSIFPCRQGRTSA